MNSPAKTAKQIFLEAIESHAPDQWPAFLDQACVDDAQLRQRVEILLKAHFGDGSLLGRPAAIPDATIDQPNSETPGAQIGPYKLLQEIGEGGMGVVFMAEQHAPVKRRVALKLIKPGMDTRQVIARFEAERQALAMMDHPNIAKVLDCGTTETGRPYFVMELVKGVPITRYCDENHLNPRERLALFVDVCHAIQHAHQKGIIHRDVKPSNILVAEYDQKPVPKIIDFGVAKALNSQLTDKTMFTQLGQIVGTIEYMSPEQSRVNQMDVDTRSDIYSLGVLLYELLTGATPFDKTRMRSAAFDELMRIIREEDPPRPSTRLSTIDTLPSIAANRKTEPKKLSLLLRGELDWIVMKAMEKDRARRYDTAAGFAADVQRYLSDETVAACPPSAGYRFQKFARRNKLAIATGSLIATALVIGIIGTGWQAVRASRAEGIAKSRLVSESAARKEAEDARSQERSQREVADQNRSEAEQARHHADAARVQAEKETLRANNVVAIIKSLFASNDPSQPGYRAADVTLREFIKDIADQLPAELNAEPEVEAEVRSILFRAGAEGGFAEGFVRSWDNLSRAKALRAQAYPPDHPVHLDSFNNEVYFLDHNFAKYGTLQPAADELLRRAQTAPDSDPGKLQAYVTWLQVQSKPDAPPSLITVSVSQDALRLARLANNHYAESQIIQLQARSAFRQALRNDLDDADLQRALRDIEAQIAEGQAAANRLPRPTLESASLLELLAQVRRLQRDFTAAERLDTQSRELRIRWNWVSDFIAPDENGPLVESSSVIPIDAAHSLYYRAKHCLDSGDIAGYRAVVQEYIALNDRSPSIERSNVGEYLYWVVSLHPQAVDDWPAMAARAERWLQSPKRMESVWPIYETGAILLRAGNPHRALEHFDRAEKLFEQYIEECPQLQSTYWQATRWYNWLFLALAHGQLGNRDEALRWYSRYALDSPRGLLLPELNCAGNDVVRHVQLEVERALKIDPHELVGDEQDARLYLARAVLLKNQGNVQGAIDQLGQAIELEPTRAIFWEVRGDWWGMLGNQGNAVQDYTEAIGRGGDLSRIRLKRGETRAQQQQLALALDDFQQAIALAPTSWDVARALGPRAGEYIRLQRYDDALRDIERGLSMGPNNPWVVSHLGLHQAAQCDDLRFRDAYLSLLSRSIELSTSNKANAFSNRGHFYYFLAERSQAIEDYTKAIEDYTKAISLDPTLIWAWNNRGDCHKNLRQFDQAIADYRAVLERGFPDINRIHRNLIDCYRETGQTEEALNELNLLVQQNPQTADNHQFRGDLLNQLARVPEAIDAYSRVIELNPKNAGAHKNRGDSYQKLGELEKAISDYQTALRLGFPDWYSLTVRLTEIYRSLGKIDQAVLDVDKIVDLDPTNALHWHQRGCYLRLLGRFEQAAAEYTRTLELDPQHQYPWAQLNRGLCRAQLGQSGLAADDYLATRKAPNSDTLFVFSRGQRLFEIQQFEQAIKDFDRVVELNPNHADALHFRGHSFCRLRETEKALMDYRRAEELDPKNTGHTLARLAAMSAVGQAEASQTELDQLIRQSADPGRLLVDYGLELIRAGWLEQMETLVTKAAEYGTSIESVMHYNLGCGYALENQPEKAFVALQRSIELGEARGDMVSNDVDLIGLRKDPRFAELLAQLKWSEWFQAGRAKYEAGQFAEAITDFTKANELNPNFGLLWLWRGRAYQASGQSAEANADFDRYLSEFNRALATQPEDWIGLNRRGVALTNLRRWDEALADLSRAIELAPEKYVLYRNRATCLLEQQRWPDAATDLARVIESNLADWQTHYHLALARLGAEDRDGYRAACRGMLAAFAETNDPLTANFIAWTCSLAPDALADWSGAIALARKSCAAEPTSLQNKNTLGMLLARAGQTEEAIQILTAVAEQLEKPEISPNTSPAYTWFALAAAYQATGQTEPARQWFDKASAWTARLLDEPATTAADPVTWNRRLTLELMRKETKSKFETDTESQGVRAK